MTTFLWWALAYLIVGGVIAHVGDRELVRQQKPMFDKWELGVVIMLWWFIVGWAGYDLWQERRR